MLYRVRIRETTSRQPSGTFWRDRVAYIGTDATEARLCYHRLEPEDTGGGYGNPARVTLFELLEDDDLVPEDPGEFVEGEP